MKKWCLKKTATTHMRGYGMFELICMSLLGISYVNACIEEKREEKINDMKISVFCYAVRHKLLYNQVVDMIKNQDISIEDIKKENSEYERKERI